MQIFNIGNQEPSNIKREVYAHLLRKSKKKEELEKKRLSSLNAEILPEEVIKTLTKIDPVFGEVAAPFVFY